MQKGQALACAKVKASGAPSPPLIRLSDWQVSSEPRRTDLGVAQE